MRRLVILALVVALTRMHEARANEPMTSAPAPTSTGSSPSGSSAGSSPASSPAGSSPESSPASASTSADDDAPPTNLGLADGRQLRVAGGIFMGVGAALCVPMALGISEHSRFGGHIWRLVDRARAESRKFTPAEFAEATDAHARATDMRTMAVASGIAAGLVFAGGLTLYILSARLDRPRDGVAARRLQLHPTLAPGHVGLGLRASF
ncbi:MAG: hypothetical protein KC468_17310 [Myxococcales bacterium]|nr:hypothetical protein [Myxococcales bacterium]